MKNNQFFANFITEFEPKFQKEIRKLSENSHDKSFSQDLIRTFLQPVMPYVETGKRIRPFLIAVGADSLNDKVIHAGIAFEILHTFILIHDDIMDGASLRRNVPTVHEAFKKQGLPGESGAMLVGDFLYACANEHMSKYVPELMPAFTKMQRFLCVGQFYEMIHWGTDVTPKVSQNIARFKSAQYSFMYPLQYGLQLAGKDIHMLDEYADAAGLGFQVRDDWLDICDEIDSGKDRDLDEKNSVPNAVQNTLKQYDSNMSQTKAAIEDLLSSYNMIGKKEISSHELSPQQSESLQELLNFSTTI